ncbi:hypothetical protein E2493_14950 [Sphingomonas parva]|uniref:Uncharacterized protein n=1 Tax=Sphingomonas parva TaxID=2555898 RepID=A0A4Y8ZND4_9SPHN|nr:hypothetical protein [Sphingomonas parva]TFI57501.1 hypothetical protein E2493_14950 [Sphingomonas parva]
MIDKRRPQETGSLTTYQFYKLHADVEAARELVSQDFVTKAFKAGAHKPRGRQSPGAEGQALPAELISWILREGRTRVAIACDAYILASHWRPERPDDTSFVRLIEQIHAGARQIDLAATALANQIRQHRRETGELDHVRKDAFLTLTIALNDGYAFYDDLDGIPYETMPGDAVADGERVFQHGLDNCRRLAHAAEEVLAEHRRTAAILRQRGERVLAMKSGRRPNRLRAEFLGDLAAIYQDGLGKLPSANRGSEANEGALSPFARFVTRIFDKFQEPQIRTMLADPQPTPSIDAIETALKMWISSSRDEDYKAKSAA